MTAARLGEAAALLRERAQDATLHPGHRLPWMVDPDVSSVVLAPKDVGGWDGIAVARDAEPADAEYIAVMGPPVGLAVAAWLEVTARDVGTSSPAYHAALAVADAILGGEPHG